MKKAPLQKPPRHRDEFVTKLVVNDMPAERVDEVIAKLGDPTDAEPLSPIAINQLATHANVPHNRVIMALLNRLGSNQAVSDGFSQNLEGNQKNKLERHYRELLINLERIGMNAPGTEERSVDGLFLDMTLGHFKEVVGKNKFDSALGSLRIWNTLDIDEKRRFAMGWGLIPMAADSMPLGMPDKGPASPPEEPDIAQSQLLGHFRSELPRRLGLQGRLEIEVADQYLHGGKEKEIFFFTEFAMLREQCLMVNNDRARAAEATITNMSRVLFESQGSTPAWKAWRYNHEASQKQLSSLTSEQREAWATDQSWDVTVGNRSFQIIETDDPTMTLHRGNSPTFNCFHIYSGVNNTEVPAVMADGNKKVFHVLDKDNGNKLIGRTTGRLFQYVDEGTRGWQPALLIDEAESEGGPDATIQEAVFRAGYSKSRLSCVEGSEPIPMFAAARKQKGYEVNITKDWEGIRAMVRVGESLNIYDNTGSFGNDDCGAIGYAQDTRGGVTYPRVQLRRIPKELLENTVCVEVRHPDKQLNSEASYAKRLRMVFPSEVQYQQFVSLHADKGEFEIAGDLSNLPPREAATWRKLILIEPRVMAYIDPKTIEQVRKINGGDPLDPELEGLDLRHALAAREAEKHYGPLVGLVHATEETKDKIREAVAAEHFESERERNLEVKRRANKEDHNLRQTFIDLCLFMIDQHNIGGLGPRDQKDRQHHNYEPLLTDADRKNPVRAQWLLDHYTVIPMIDFEGVANEAFRRTLDAASGERGETVEQVRNQVRRIFGPATEAKSLGSTTKTNGAPRDMKERAS